MSGATRHHYGVECEIFRKLLLRGASYQKESGINSEELQPLVEEMDRTGAVSRW